jgi:hypothetical protein
VLDSFTATFFAFGSFLERNNQVLCDPQSDIGWTLDSSTRELDTSATNLLATGF